MNTTKLKRSLTATLIAALAITTILLYQTSRKARDENAALQQQIASLAADNEALSNRLQRTGPVTPSDDQTRELLRLRGEVALLRHQTNATAKLKHENRNLKSSAPGDEATISSAIEENFRFEAMSARTVTAAKRLGLAARTAAMGNNGIFPTDFAAITNQADYPKEFPIDTFDILNLGIPIDKWPYAIMARERSPRQNPNGGWERIYLLADGGAIRIFSPDGNFDNREIPNAERIIELGPSSMWRSSP